MPIKPEQLFEAALALNRLRPPLVSDEVCARTMANRMYYAAYHAIREAIRAHRTNAGFDVTHTSLETALNEAPDPDVRDFGLRFSRLKEIREAADYKASDTVSKLRAAMHLGDAKFVLDNARQLSVRFPPMRAR